MIDVRGQRFGTLTAVSGRRHNNRTLWLCQCECGRQIEMRIDALRKAKSCGCLDRRIPPDGKKRHGLGKTPENAIWRSMVNRCNAPGDTNYPKYGARGIKVCDRWLFDFRAFLEDMGPRPSPAHSIDRIRSEGHYEPDNCRWALLKTQSRNKRDNHLVTVGGETMPLVAAVERYGGSYHTVKARIYRGWSIERALGLQEGASP